MTKEKRFNKAVFWPEWGDGLLEEFISSLDISDISLTDHANEKLNVVKSYRRKKDAIVEHINTLELDHKKIFEFYLDENDRVKKICHRDRLNDYYDIILVISEEPKVVTFYINRNNYVHPNLDETKYAKEHHE